MITKIIAIDGPAAGGKGTIAKKLAEYFDFAHMDTGALYRLVGWGVLQDGGDPDSKEDAIAAAYYLKSNFVPEMSENELIRSADVGNAASQVGFFPEVRQALHELQVNFAQNPPEEKKGAVLDGRDIGTVICPNADVKLYVTASTEVRADRRTKELQGRGFDVAYENILEDMRVRDERDAGRDAAPMKPADDAILVDTSAIDAEEAYSVALQHVLKSISK